MDNASASGADEAPFMVVPHAPDQPLAKLRVLYEAIKELLFHLRKHVWHASAFSSERQFSVLNTSDYKQVREVPLLFALLQWHAAASAFLWMHKLCGACGRLWLYLVYSTKIRKGYAVCCWKVFDLGLLEHSHTLAGGAACAAGAVAALGGPSVPASWSAEAHSHRG